MTTLVDKAILSGADNRPPMLEKDMYNSWKSRMKLYMTNTQHGRMILESVENGPLIWPTIEENGVTRLRKYSELSATYAIQGSGYHQKDRKPSQNDKTEHGMEKTVQNQGQSLKMPKSESILKNQQSNRSRN
ncbi:hypothetical protein Tco_0670792 [Tanacetum coccineum]